MDKTITILIIAYNEQKILPFTINWYRKMFDSPKFIIYNNFSTDSTKQIALELGCEVVDFDTKVGMNDTIHAQIKSGAILDCKTDFILCLDADEECLITQEDLNTLEANVVVFEGWNIFSEVNTPEEVEMPPMGVLCTAYSKPILIRCTDVARISYNAGAHSLAEIIPVAGKEIIYSVDEFKLLHYKHYSNSWNKERSKELGARQSEDNLKKRHSFHFAFPESIHDSYFKENFSKREVITDERLKLLQ